MTWGEAKEHFETALNRRANRGVSLSTAGLFATTIFSNEYMKIQNISKRAKKFVQNLDQLRDLTEINKSSFEKILEAAANALENSAKYENLNHLLVELEETMKANSRLIHVGAGLEIALDTMYFLVAGKLAMSGAFLIAASVAAAATGPVGWIILGMAVGLGLAALSILLVGGAAIDAYRNYRVCRDSQIKEIREFVDLLKPVEATNEAKIKEDDIIDGEEIVWGRGTSIN